MSDLTDTERLIREARARGGHSSYPSGRKENCIQCNLADALEAAIAREQAAITEKSQAEATARVLVQAAIKELDHIQAVLNVAAIELCAANADKLRVAVAALKPFAAIAEEFTQFWRNANDDNYVACSIRLSDLDNASTALKTLLSPVGDVSHGVDFSLEKI